MRRRGHESVFASAAVAALVLAVAGLIPSPGHAAASPSCPAPGAGDDWQVVSPADAGMEADRLREAIALGTRNGSFAIRVYRNGCRVAEDPQAEVNRHTRFESWSLAKSVTALVFGRAMTLGLIGPDDPLGSLVPEADQAHGEITLRELLTMTSGLHWNGFRDYNVFMGNRLQEALTVPVEKEPGTYWEYSQSGPALVAEAVQRAVGEDFQDFAQRELFRPIGIADDAWQWRRDGNGHTQGFFGLNMHPDDFARLGELMRRGGVWRGRRLFSRRFVDQALTPIAESGCYGWLIWLNASKPCVGPRIIGRPVSDERDFPSLPADAFQYAGLFGQWVTVFPSQGVVVVRVGIDVAGTFAGDTAWQEEMYSRILNSIVDDETHFPPPSPDASQVSDEDVDRGFLHSLARPIEILQGELPPPLPPPGPARARATLIEHRAITVGRGGRGRIPLRCPHAWPSGLGPGCDGKARLGGIASRRYSIPAGESRRVAFLLPRRTVRRLEREGRLRLPLTTRNDDELAGTIARRQVVIRAR